MIPPDSSRKYIPLNSVLREGENFPRYLSVTMGIPSKTRDQPGILVRDLPDVTPECIPGYVNIDEHIMKDDPQLRFLEAEKCIYCGSTTYKDNEGSLTDEHVVPKGLGGNIVIGTASCYNCQTIINHYEGRLLRVMLWNVRIKLKLRNNKRNPQKAISVISAIIDGKLTETELSEEINPSFLVLPHFEVPRIISSSPSTFGFRGLYINSFANLANLEDQEFANFRTPTVDSQAFCQMLAKIAHGYAISKYGVEWSEDNTTCKIGKFYASLNKMILSRLDRSDDRQDFYNLVGQVPGNYLASNALHQIGSNSIRCSNGIYLVVYIRPFAYLESPIYQVVVGTTNNYQDI